MHLSWRVFWSLMCPGSRLAATHTPGTPTQPDTCPTAGLLVLPQWPPAKGKQNLPPPSRELQRTRKACRWSLRIMRAETAIPLYVPSHGLFAVVTSGRCSSHPPLGKPELQPHGEHQGSGCTLHPMGLRGSKEGWLLRGTWVSRHSSCSSFAPLPMQLCAISLFCCAAHEAGDAGSPNASLHPAGAHT